LGRRGDTVILPDFAQEVEREDDRHRTRLAATGDPESIVDHKRDLRRVANLKHRLADGPEDRRVGRRVDLKRGSPRSAVDIGDQAHNRHAVQ
jgi:hypothetical protein